jgi:hypothetical protein
VSLKGGKVQEVRVLFPSIGAFKKAPSEKYV